MNTCTHAYMHTCIHAYMHTCIPAYMHTCIHTCIHAYMHTCIHAYMNTCTHAHMHTCIHAYMHTCRPSLAAGHTWPAASFFDLAIRHRHSSSSSSFDLAPPQVHHIGRHLTGRSLIPRSFLGSSTFVLDVSSKAIAQPCRKHPDPMT